MPWLELKKKDRLHTLRGIVPEARPHFAILIEQAKSWGMHPYISVALRTCEEQGRLTGQSAVSTCRSWHTLGRAVDLELREADGSPADASTYNLLGEFWESMGGIWGGRWVALYPNGIPGFPDAGPGDPVHFQWTGKRSGVPAAICPRGALSLEQCQAHANAYIAAQWASPPTSPPRALQRLPAIETPRRPAVAPVPVLLALVASVLLTLGLSKAARA